MVGGPLPATRNEVPVTQTPYDKLHPAPSDEGMTFAHRLARPVADPAEGAQVKRDAPSASRRSDVLLNWISERETHEGLTAREIAEVSGIYDNPGVRPKTKADAARRDLNDLHYQQRLVEPVGSPARWYLWGAGWRA